MLQKICRLCQNTAMWKHPAIKYNENKKAYTSRYGFGFEEWLNREEWLLSGYNGLAGKYRYAHVQGLATKNNAYGGQDARILFYVKEAGLPAQAVAVLEHCVVLDPVEATWAAKQFTKNKWLHIMHAEVKAIGGNTEGLPPIPDNDNILLWENPLFYANIRFLHEDLHFLDPRREISLSSFYYRVALDWDGKIPSADSVLPSVSVPNLTEDSSNSRQELNRFSEEVRNRRASAGKAFLPRQAPIQNKLSLQLEKYYAPKGGIVMCEDDRVDITLTISGKKTFIEIKPSFSARQAIRESIGQLLEYSHYPDNKKADKLAIVSDAPLGNNDRLYISHLNQMYGFNLEFIYWPPEKGIAADLLALFEP